MERMMETGGEENGKGSGRGREENNGREVK